MPTPVTPPVAQLCRSAPEEAWVGEIGEVRLLSGAGLLSSLGQEARALGAGCALVVTDPGLVSSGHPAKAIEALEAAGVETLLFDGAAPNPTDKQVIAGTELAKTKSIDLVVAVGGGSAMDCTKGINFLLTNGGRMQDYWGLGKATEPMLPSIGVPTTAGTGSDAQSYALITDAETHRKMACGDPKARFHTVILDPDLLATVPRRVAAAAGMDALSHALESFVTTVRTPTSSSLAREAFALLEPTIEQAARPNASLKIRHQALIGAHLAGAAIEQSMLGAAHAAANPLTARHGIPHGEAIALTLPGTIRFNGADDSALYSDLWPDGAKSLARRVESLRAALDLPDSLSSLGVDASDLANLANMACDEWTGKHNPRPADQFFFEELYASAL